MTTISRSMIASVAAFANLIPVAHSQLTEAQINKLVLEADHIMRTQHTVHYDTRCLAYVVDAHSTRAVAEVDVRENHSRPGCKGDPETEPRMLTLGINHRTGRRVVRLRFARRFSTSPVSCFSWEQGVRIVPPTQDYPSAGN